MALRKKPRIGITLGDVAGIGPEVALKALRDPSIEEHCVPIIIGEETTVAHYAGRLLPERRLHLVEGPEAASPGTSRIHLLNLKNIRFSAVKLGQVDRECGRASLEYIRAGAAACLEQKLDALVTGPIHKEAAQMAGIGAPGHTEFLAALCQVAEVRMLLVVDHLRAIHVTTHMSLRQALQAIRKERILQTIRFGRQALKRLGVPRSRIAAAGLNPHAGEGGLFGTEEGDEIIPALQAARAEGLAVHGPISPDTVFHRMNRGEFDLVIALYHDQGHIPLKLLGFDSGVNITIGLPIVRTSVDHGTAFDIAGQLKANPASMIKAIHLACVMANTRD
jgi:4-hydroxythreonine-4-phosphate dehydrogenase